MSTLNKFLILLIVAMNLTITACSTTKSSLDQAKLSYAQHDYPRAFNELSKAAADGNPKAEYALGYMYYYGLGTDKNAKMAEKLFRQAAAKNYLPAEKALHKLMQTQEKQYVPLEQENIPS